MNRGFAVNLTALGISLAVCFAAAGLGSVWTFQGLAQWYPSLRKPSWTPPNWVFGPVWTALYTAMAVAAWLVWRRRGLAGARGALALFGLQLLLNTTWSGLFFGMRRPGLAFGEVVLFWLAILATLVAFWRIDRVAGGLLVPYLVWVSFASALNFAVWRLNA